MLHIQRFVFNPFQENTYLLFNDENNAWLIDPGNSNPQETKALADFIKERKLKLEKILLTHAHIDHIFGLQWAYDTFKTPVILHPKADEILGFGKQSAEKMGLDFEDFQGEKKFLSEGEHLKLGDEVFEIYFTPGHAPGHIVFHNKKNNFVFSGDTLFQGSIGRTDLYKGDFNRLMKSIGEKLLTLDDKTTVLSGHGNPTEIGIEKKTNPFL